MPITFASSNDSGERIILERIHAHRKDPPFRSLRTDQITLSHPHYWYGVGLEDLIAGNLLAAVKPSSYLRYILLHQSKPSGIGSLRIPKDGGNVEYHALYDTCFSEETFKALEFASTLPSVGSKPFELRFLSSFPVYFFSIWLHSESEDLIIPLPPTYDRMKEYTVLGEKEILDGLKHDINYAQEFSKKLCESCETARELRDKSSEKRNS